MLRRFASTLLVSGLLAACAGPLGHAQRDFDRGCYPTALRELRALEAEARNFGSDEQARYALYRGLSELALGDARLAHHWLGRARQLDRRDATLTPSDRVRLEAAWRALGLMPGESG